jgi:membrane protease YdiL (CAAX protease family)
VSEQTGKIVNWTARDGWRCFLALIIFETLLALILHAAHGISALAGLLRDHETLVQSVVKIIRAGIWLSLAYWLSNTRTVCDFIRVIKLDKKPTLGGWFATLIAVVIALLGNYSLVKRFDSPDPAAMFFFKSSGWAFWFYVLFVVSLGPFFEEVVLRGFLLTAFRGNYGILASSMAVISLGMFFHWGPVMRSPYSALCLILLWALLCCLREWTDNLWNCVFAHLFYNAAGIVKWPIIVCGMLAFFVICDYRKIAEESERGEN